MPSTIPVWVVAILFAVALTSSWWWPLIAGWFRGSPKENQELITALRQLPSLAQVAGIKDWLDKQLAESVVHTGLLIDIKDAAGLLVGISDTLESVREYSHGSGLSIENAVNTRGAATVTVLQECVQRLSAIQTEVSAQSEMMASEPAVPQPDAEVRECLREIQKGVDNLQVNGKSQADRQFAATNILIDSVNKLTESQQAFLKMIFGGGSGGYVEMDEDAQALRDKAQEIQKRYGTTWDEAMEQARNVMSIQSGAGMVGSI